MAAVLRDRLTDLPLDVEAARCEVAEVAVAAYPGGVRPSSTVVLTGRGSAGTGEHVGWTREAHRDFAARVAEIVLERSGTVGEAARRIAAASDDPYDRAALEAAAIDLALRQAATSLARLLGATPRPVRYVVSFERSTDPVERARAERTPAGPIELKIDVDPVWDEGVLRALAALGCVRILDFKLSGDVPEHERAHRRLPDAWLEDPLPGAGPWSPSLLRRRSVDAPITSAAALAALDERPAAVNVKPARMGGVLEALACIALCQARGLPFYLGGMFEVGVGRAQLHALAALLCPDAPNDVAPIALGDASPFRPPRIAPPPDAPGFAPAG